MSCKTVRLVFASLVTATLLACDHDPSDSLEVPDISVDQAKQEIREAQQRWMEAAIRKDEPVLREILGDEYHLIAGRLGFVDKDGWLAMGPAYTIEEFEYMESDIHYLTDVWVKRDERWQVVTRHSSIAETP